MEQILASEHGIDPASVMSAMALPMNVTRLPDTRPLLRRSPVSKSLPPAACVLRQVQRDEDRMGEGALKGVVCQVKPVAAGRKDRRDPDRAAGLSPR